MATIYIHNLGLILSQNLNVLLKLKQFCFFLKGDDEDFDCCLDDLSTDRALIDLQTAFNTADQMTTGQEDHTHSLLHTHLISPHQLLSSFFILCQTSLPK